MAGQLPYPKPEPSHTIYDGQIEFRLRADAYKGMTDSEVEDLCEKISDELDLGLAAVGRSITGKLGGGKLTYRIR